MDKEHNEHAGKTHKPAKDHPWRKFVRSEVAEWAKDKSTMAKPTNYLKGGGKPQK
jgi:hypothetical protein